MENIKFNLEEVKWAEVRDEVYLVNPEFADKCDSINKFNKYSLFKIKYPYGASIVNKGEFCLPTIDGKTISIKDEKVPEYLKNKLTYSYIPLSLVLNNSSEVSVKIQNRVIPLNFLESGELFGLFELMNVLTDIFVTDTPIWNVSAGARSAFMIPCISDTIGHNRIRKKYNLNVDAPQNFLEQWQIFVDIAKHNTNKNSWNNTILVFSNEWFEQQDTIGYIELYKYLVNQCWQQFALLNDFTGFSILWSFFTNEINIRNLKPRAYLIETIKYLFLIAKGSGIAFKPSMDDTALPIKLIQKIYLEDYNLKNYIPTIMQPAKFTKDTKVYYSLSFPTLFDNSPYFKNPPSIIEDQREIQKLLNILMRTISKIEDPNVNSLENIKFEFFHSSHDPFGKILSSKMISQYDDRFLIGNKDYINNNLFCSSSSFFNGCISIENCKN